MRSTTIVACVGVLLASLLGGGAQAAASPAASSQTAPSSGAASPVVAAAGPAVAVAAMPRAFTGYAFDACEAPDQATMDAWRTSSPFWGVGVYIAGDNRLCEEQANLTTEWVATQAARGWRILPITVGRQPSCTPLTGVSKINPDPANTYEAARREGRVEADASADAAELLGFAPGTTLWLDIEDFPPFDNDNNPETDLNRDCRRSMLQFVSRWTSRLHELGFKSGLYSNAAAGITAVEGARTLSPGSYNLPDQVWFAHFNGQATTSTSYIRSDGWRRQRIHQYVGDRTVTYGGVELKIDYNWMDVGGGTVAPAAAPHCGVRIDFGSYGTLRRGATGARVKALQCLLRKRGVYAGSLHGRYDLATSRAVLRYQRRFATLGDTGVCAPSTWMALLSAGSASFVKVGSGAEAVRRLQRTLNAAASEGLVVTGVFDRRTEAAVKRYQSRRRLPVTGVVTAATWAPLQQGRR